MPYREKLSAYATLGHQEMRTGEFKQFCAEHLSNLEDVALEFFATEKARNAVRGKVETLFPEHEVEEFTDLFWSRIQKWNC